MDIQGKDQKIIKRVLSSKGPLSESQIGQEFIVFSHEYLNPQISTIKSHPLNLQTLSYHRANPFTLENSSITATLFQHQMKELTLPSKSTFIIDCSRYDHNQKTPENLRKYNIIRGYSYGLPRSIIPSQQSNNKVTLSKQAQASTSKEYISNQLEYEFNSSTSVEPSGFIGKIELACELQQIRKERVHSTRIYEQILKKTFQCYLDFSAKSGCPILIDLNLPHKNNNFAIIVKDQGQTKEALFMFSETLQGLALLFPSSNCNQNIVLSNPQLIFSVSFPQNNSQFNLCYQLRNFQQIRNLYSKGYQICFELARYQNKEAILAITKFLYDYPSQTILSFGIRYKTDMKAFGGEGLKMSESFSIMKNMIGDQTIIEKARSLNMLKLLCWHEKKEVIKKVVMWKCVGCQKQLPETEEAFRKFNKNFCSIGCLKSYKF